MKKSLEIIGWKHGQRLVGYSHLHITAFLSLSFLVYRSFLFPSVAGMSSRHCHFHLSLALYPVWKPPNLSAFQLSIFWRSPFLFFHNTNSK